MSSKLATTRSTARAERENALCDELLRRLKQHPNGATVDTLCDGADCTHNDAKVAIERLQGLRLVNTRRNHEGLRVVELCSGAAAVL